MVRTKRVYEEAKQEDGYRVLVDRLWPRGMKKEAARIDLWMKDVAPSDALRKSFHHEAMRSEEHTSELQSRLHLVCRLLLEKKKNPTRAVIPAVSQRYVSCRCVSWRC